MENLVGSPEFLLPEATTCGLYVTQPDHAHSDLDHAHFSQEHWDQYK